MRAIRWARNRVAVGGASGERGASLVLALAFLTLFGALIVTLLGFVQAAYLANGRVHKQGVAQYAMAGAIDADIQRARRDGAMGVTSCDDLTYSGVTVRCTPQPGDGGLIPGLNAPWNAILTLGGGITNTQTGSTLAVAGPVYSSGAISLAAGSKLDAADLPVTGASCGSDTATWKYAQPIVSCPPIAGATPPAAAGADPNYASAPLPSLATPKGLADVQCVAGAAPYYSYPAGYYNDAAVLRKTGCTGAVARVFASGVYYFDLVTGGVTDWTINDGIPVIGGTASAGWLGVTAPPVAPKAKDLTPAVTACDRTQPGVQFVFGGGSTITGSSTSRVELCPLVPGQIALYGQRNTIVSSLDLFGTGVNPAPTVCTAAPTIATPPCWRDEGQINTFTASRVLANDNQRAQAVVPEPASGTASAPLTVAGFPAASVPAAWGGFDVTITVPHGDGLVDPSNPNLFVANNKASTAIYLTVGGCPAFNLLAKQGGFQNNNNQIVTPLSKSAFSGADQAIYDCIKTAITSPFSVTYDPQVTKGGGQQDAILLSALDGIKFTLTPVATLPRPQSSAGPFLQLQSGAKFASWGTVYMTNADFRIAASGSVVFDRGVILKSLIFSGGTEGEPVFRVGGGRRNLLLEATDQNRRVRALVTVTDYQAAGYWARVKRWNVSR